MTEQNTFKCIQCSIEKTFDFFPPDSTRKNNIKKTCKSCTRENKRSWYKINSENFKDIISSNRKISHAGMDKLSRDYFIYKVTKYRATNKGIEFNIDQSDIIIPDICPATGIEFYKGKGKPSVDRIDSNFGYVKGNVWVVDSSFNSSKKDKTYEQYCRFVKDVMENRKRSRLPVDILKKALLAWKNVRNDK